MDSGILARLAMLLRPEDTERGRLVRSVFEQEATHGQADLERILSAGAVADLLCAGLVRETAAGLEPVSRIDVLDGLLVAADRYANRRQRAFVVGPGPASRLLAGAIRPVRAGRVLDLGTGSGVQALLLARRGGEALALDINGRALAYARFNAALNGLGSQVTVVRGDFLAARPDPDLDGRFDLVVANPPFVLSPSSELTYRDRTLPGDEVTRRTVARVARSLAPGGRGYVLGAWIDRGRTWSEPVRRWITAPFSVAVFRVATQTPWAYAAAWTRDLAAGDRERVTEAWATALVDEGVECIHTGVIVIGRGKRRLTRGSFRDWEGAPAWQTVEAILAG